MYIVNKGFVEQVSMPTETSAIDLIAALAVLGCPLPLTKKVIIGNKEKLDIYEVCFLDKHIKVYGKENAERVAHWMLELGCRKVSIEKLEGEEDGRKEE